MHANNSFNACMMQQASAGYHACMRAWQDNSIRYVPEFRQLRRGQACWLVGRSTCAMVWLEDRCLCTTQSRASGVLTSTHSWWVHAHQTATIKAASGPNKDSIQKQCQGQRLWPQGALDMQESMRPGAPQCRANTDTCLQKEHLGC